ncbi:hypothetical protein HXX76_013983 [Chlamydomonas incerta]|uniref:Fe2OG dioxygenase domain-containing protein n=1 Tax=Chlamydomonas incerta TaxID=51695 RepID=A0A835SMQ2_CHLIN|nr:hypothetical protein HXX76_013983 [Chlamydomonas incerta]|eukprot:KAG2425074.1 hypothetical protein HXX76_013983 [Chlamydomonas incerta]
MYFIKAPPGLVTRYLWVGGVHGLTTGQLADLFAPWGQPTVVLPDHTPAATPTPPAAADQPPPSLGTAGGTAATAASGEAASEVSAAAALAAAAGEEASGSGAPAPTAAAADAARHNGDGSEPPLRCFHAFLEFPGEEHAAAAAAAVPKGGPWAAAGGRKIVATFADLRRDKRPVPRPVATSTQGMGVPGLELLTEFVSPQQEAALLAAVAAAEAEAAEAAAGAGAASCSGRGGGGGGGGGGGAVGQGTGWEVLAKRRVQHYGYRFDYLTRNVDLAKPLGPLPAWAAQLAARIGELPQVSMRMDQLTVNEYEPGVGLSPHIDTHSAFTGPIISLSLGSAAVMELRRGEAARPLLLPPRSLLIMGGESRYAWQHYIPHRLSDVVEGESLVRGRRLSLTFRQARGFACDCAYPEFCDSQEGVLPPTRISLLRQPQPQPQPQSQQSEEEGVGGVAVAGGPTAASVANGGGGSGGGAQAGAAPSISTSREASGAAANGGAAQGAAAGAGAGTSRGGSGEDQQGSPAGAGGGAGGAGGANGDEEGEEEEESRLAALEAEYVHKVYDAIAPHFSSTRFAIWPRVRAFIESLPPGGLVADVGCGNGKYFGVRPDLAVLGSDISAGLVAVAAARLHAPHCPATPHLSPPRAADALVADALRLPYRAACADGALCIAVLHHLSSPARRVRLLRQLLRVLRPGGRAIVTVWATEQEDPKKTLAKWTRIPTVAADGGAAATASATAATAATAAAAAGAAATDRMSASSSCTSLNDRAATGPATPRVDTGPAEPAGAAVAADAAASDAATAEAGADYFVPWHLPFHRTETARAAKAAKEAAVAAGSSAGGEAAAAAPKVDESKGAVVFQRYYHLFTQQELAALVEEALAAGPADADDTAGGDDAGGQVHAPGLAGAGSGARPCGVLEEVFYDRSNWCAVFRRDA